MAQHDYVISNGTGAAVRSDLNNALSAIVTQNSGSTEPTTTYAYQMWADTTAGVMKIRNGANSAWITLYQLDGEWTSIAFENGSAAAPSIYFKDSGTDTGFYSPGTDQVAISTGGTGRLFINSSGSVGIGTSDPGGDSASSAENLVIGSASSSLAGITINTGTGSFQGRINFGRGSTNQEYGYILCDHFNAKMQFGLDSSTKVTLDSSGRLGIGTTAPQSILHLAGTSPQLILDPGSGSTDPVSINSWRTNAPIVFKPGDTERVRIDGSGRLLVGTSTARGNLYLGGSAISPPLQIETSGSTYSSGLSLLTYSASNYAPVLTLGTSASNTPGTNAALSSGSNLGLINFVGNDGTNFRSGAYIYADIDGGVSTGDLPTRLVFSTTADGASSPTERMRIRSDGALTLSDNATLDPIGGNKVGGFAAGNGASSGAINYYAGNTVALKLGRGDNGDIVFFYRNQPSAVNVGSISVTTTATAYNTSSDYRLKENVTPVTNGITRLQQLKPSRFNFIADPDQTVDGFIAHEVQDVVPEAIHGKKDAVDDNGNPIYQGIDQSKLVPLLTAALQEAIGEIESLKARVAALESA